MLNPIRLSRAFASIPCLLLCAAASATTLQVPSQYATIQSAIDASFAGDVVEVGPGIYMESLNFGGREIIVRSTAGAATTVVDPVAGRCLTASGQKGASARLEGFTLRGGNSSQGGGVYVQSSSPTIANCVIIANAATESGGGVYVASGDPTFINCTISSNQGTYQGGGVYVYNGSITLDACTLVANMLTYPYGTNGGGIALSSASAIATITGGEIRGNSATQGGGIYNGSVTINNCTIESNVAQYSGSSSGNGGGIHSSTVTITGGSVKNNTTDGEGGGLYGVTGQVNGCTISGNTAAGNGAGVSSYGALMLSWSTLEDNVSGGTGGAWYKSSGSGIVQECEVKNNSALTVGGLWLNGGLTTILGSNFCGNGVNITGSWVDAGANSFTLYCDPVCIGDCSPDGAIDGADLTALLAQWGPCGLGCNADFNDDGLVSGADLTIMLTAWGVCQ